MASYFYPTIIDFMNLFMSVGLFKRHTADKPWVKDKFCYLIRCMQHTFGAGNAVAYNKHSNAAERLAKELRRLYYQRKVQDLLTTVKFTLMMGQRQAIHKRLRGTQLNALCNFRFAGEVDLMPIEMNDFFANVACDMPPLSHDFLTNLDHSNNEHDHSDSVITQSDVECSLQNIKIHKSPSPDDIAN